MLCACRLLLAVTVSQTFNQLWWLFLMILSSLKISGQASCTHPCFYLLLNWNYMLWAERLQGLSTNFFIPHQGYIPSTYFILVDFYLDHLVEVMLGFLMVKFFFSPFPRAIWVILHYFPKEPSSVLWRMVLETKLLVLTDFCFFEKNWSLQSSFIFILNCEVNFYLSCIEMVLKAVWFYLMWNRSL